MARKAKAISEAKTRDVGHTPTALISSLCVVCKSGSSSSRQLMGETRAAAAASSSVLLLRLLLRFIQ
jgi:hypothetical protein